MQINARGRVIGSVGGAGVWLATANDPARCVVQPPSGQAGWRTDTECAYQAPDNELRFFDVVSGVDRGTEDRLGVSLVRGAAGQYGVWLASATGTVRGSVNVPSGGILGAADDGTLFVIAQDYSVIEAYTDGVLRWTQRNSYPVIYYPAPQFSCLDADRCCWWNAQANRIETRGLGNPVPQTWGNPTDLFVVELNGQLYLGYHSDKFYLHPFSDKSRGWIVAEGSTYYTCGRAYGGGILCAWSTDPAESGIVTCVIDPRSPMVDLTPPVEPLPPVHITPFHHPMWVGCYFATGQYGNVDHPGSSEVLVRTSFSQMVQKRPVFADLESARTVPDGNLLGVYMSAVEGGASDANIDEAMAYAARRGVPSLIYSDTDDYPQWICDRYLTEPNRIPVVRGYPAEKHQGEPLKATPAEDVARIRRTCESLSRRYARVALAHTYYTQANGTTDNYPLSHILAMQEGLAAIERDLQLFASLGFSRLRTGGGDMSKYPELLDAYTQECAAPEGTPRVILLPGDQPGPAASPSSSPSASPSHEPPRGSPSASPSPSHEPAHASPSVSPSPGPEPPGPTPGPEEPMPITVGQKGQFRPLGSTKGAWTKAVVVQHQDEHLYGDKPIIYGISTDPNGEGHICNWQDKGKFEDNRATAGGGERSSFDGRNLLVARPDDFADCFEWINLS